MWFWWECGLMLPSTSMSYKKNETTGINMWTLFIQCMSDCTSESHCYLEILEYCPVSSAVCSVMAVNMMHFHLKSELLPFFHHFLKSRKSTKANCQALSCNIWQFLQCKYYDCGQSQLELTELAFERDILPCDISTMLMQEA